MSNSVDFLLPIDTRNPITTETRPIETAKQGDAVVTRNPLTGETEVRRVVSTSHSHTDLLLAITLDDALTGEPLETIEATRQHPIAEVGKGFVPAAALGIGSLIVLQANQ